ncbi:hypothetical protein JCM11491_007173 [Sporobolomyces phaffii]
MAALPSQTELNELVARQDAIQAQLDAHRDLSERLKLLVDQRERGNAKMELPVELGPGFTAEGVVHDTKRIIVAAGIDDLWLDLPVEQAQAFVHKRTELLEKRRKDLDRPIAQMKADYALVAKTLRDAFQLPDDDATASA